MKSSKSFPLYKAFVSRDEVESQFEALYRGGTDSPGPLTRNGSGGGDVCSGSCKLDAETRCPHTRLDLASQPPRSRSW